MPHFYVSRLRHFRRSTPVIATTFTLLLRHETVDFSRCTSFCHVIDLAFGHRVIGARAKKFYESGVVYLGGIQSCSVVSICKTCIAAGKKIQVYKKGRLACALLRLFIPNSTHLSLLTPTTQSNKKNCTCSQFRQKITGESGHRSRCLSHAKRALYHLS